MARTRASGSLLKACDQRKIRRYDLQNLRPCIYVIHIRNMMGYKCEGGLETGRIVNVETYRSFIVAKDVNGTAC